MSATAEEPVERPARTGPRGRVWLYAIAFVLLLASGWLQAKGAVHARIGLVRSSIWLSVGAILVAAASVLAPARRPRPAKADRAAPGPDAPPDAAPDAGDGDSAEEGRSPSAT